MGKLYKSYFSASALFLSILIPNSSYSQCLSGSCYAYADASSLQICEGQQITLTSDGGSAALYNNFNGQTVGNGWLTNNINAMFNNPCGAAGIDGTPYLWFGNTAGAGQRILTSADFNLSAGGVIQFDLRFAIQGQASPCEGPDLADEGVYLQYSTNFGASWVNIQYFDPMGGGAANPTTIWNSYSFAIPGPAQTTCTRFRWFQTGNSGADFDHWGLDNIFIGGPPPDPGTITFQWLDNGAQGGPDRIVQPLDDTQYVLMYAHSADTCYDTVNVVVYDVPVADLVVNPLQACVGSPVQFDASGTNSGTTPITNYKWIFNNSGVVNQTTTVPTTAFTFPVTGTFNTKVITTAGICADTATVQVVVSNPPQVNFTLPSKVCAGSEFTVDASAATIAAPGVIDTYDWDFGNDGSVDISTTQTQGNYTLSTPGLTPVKLTITSVAGCAASSIQNTTVFEVPQAGFSFNDACIGQSTVFANESQGTVTNWNWDFAGIQNSTAQNPSLIFPGAGSYTVTLIANNGNVCYDTISQTFEIKNTVNADFSFNDPCLLTGIYTDLSTIPVSSEGTINSWNWNFGNGSTSTDQNPTHEYTNNGIYGVTLIVETDRGCKDTVTYQVPRYATPVASFSAEPVCFGQITQFANTSSVSSGQIVASAWSYGDGQVSSDFSPAYSYDADGNFAVTLIVVTENNCADTVSANYEVYPQPVPNFEISPPNFTDMLSPDVQFTDLSTNTDSWTWLFGTSGGASDQNPLYTFTNSGAYTITLIASNSDGCKAALSQSYDVLPAYNFYVPASFTPFNGDNLNTEFRAYHSGVKDIFFTIYNAWGEEILTTADPYFVWDGTFRGQRCQQGVYVYRAWVRDLEGKQHDYRGSFLLLY